MHERRLARVAQHVQGRQQRQCWTQALDTQQHHVGSLDASGLKIAVIIARFNDLVTKLLLEGALDAFKRHGGAQSEVSCGALHRRRPAREHLSL